MPHPGQSGQNPSTEFVGGSDQWLNKLIIVINNKDMEIKRITIENLLSFKKSVFNFKKYNVICGSK